MFVSHEQSLGIEFDDANKLGYLIFDKQTKHFKTVIKRKK